MYRDTQAKLENTIFEVRLGEQEKVLSYRIRPADGYRLHEISLDEAVIDEGTHKETSEVKRGFTRGYVTAGADYDFERNERQIYAEREE